MGRVSLNGTRKVLFLAGLAGASIALTIYVAFVIYAFRIHGFGTNFRPCSGGHVRAFGSRYSPSCSFWQAEEGADSSASPLRS